MLLSASYLKIFRARVIKQYSPILITIGRVIPSSVFFYGVSIYCLFIGADTKEQLNYITRAIGIPIELKGVILLWKM